MRHTDPSRHHARLAMVALLLAAFGATLLAEPAAEDSVFSAMKDELQRSMEKLRIEGLEKPYFLAYRVTETIRLDAVASFGSLLSKNESRQRHLTVEVRVGSYELDNSSFVSLPSWSMSEVDWQYADGAELPIDDDYGELRRQIWLATDVAYRTAVLELSKKKAALQNRTRLEEIADFSKEEVAHVRDERPKAEGDLKAAERLVVDLSALFRQASDVFTSQVSYSLSNARVRYVNSEGTTYERLVPGVRLEATASTQAADGMPVTDFVSAYGRVDLPAENELADRIRAMCDRLRRVRSAPLIDRYNGPVIFEGQAAAELLGQAFVPKLLAHRAPVMEDARMGGMDPNTTYYRVLEERAAGGGLTVAYTYGTALLKQSLGPSFYHGDAIGSTRSLTDVAQLATTTYAYEAFGTLLAAPGTTPNKYLFAGEEREEGLYNLRARYYDSQHGSFLTRDPLPGSLRRPQTIPPYLYARVNPTRFTDPGGLQSVGEYGGAVNGTFFSGSLGTSLLKFPGASVDASCNNVVVKKAGGRTYVGADVGRMFTDMCRQVVDCRKKAAPAPDDPTEGFDPYDFMFATKCSWGVIRIECVDQRGTNDDKEKCSTKEWKLKNPDKDKFVGGWADIGGNKITLCWHNWTVLDFQQIMCHETYHCAGMEHESIPPRGGEREMDRRCRECGFPK